MGEKNSAYQYLEYALNEAYDKLDKNDWQKLKTISSFTKDYQKEKFASHDFDKLVIATSALLMCREQDKVKDFTEEELELFSIAFSFESLMDFNNDIEISFTKELTYFDKDVLGAILAKKLTKKESMNFIWNLEEELYEEGSAKEDILKFILNSSNKDIEAFDLRHSQHSLEYFDKNKSEMSKICL